MLVCQGVVEKTINDPTSADRDALVPGGLIPGSSTPNQLQSYVAESEDKLVLPTGLSAKCRENSFSPFLLFLHQHPRTMNPVDKIVILRHRSIL